MARALTKQIARRRIAVPRTGLCNSDVVRIAGEIERRMLELFRPEPTPAPENSPRKIDQDDLLTPQQAAHLFCKSDQTIYRWITQFEISICIAGTAFVSRRKLEAHLAWRRGRDAP
jgi:hypothetical protein